MHFIAVWLLILSTMCVLTRAQVPTYYISQSMYTDSACTRPYDVNWDSVVVPNLYPGMNEFVWHIYESAYNVTASCQQKTRKERELLDTDANMTMGEYERFYIQNYTYVSSISNVTCSEKMCWYYHYINSLTVACTRKAILIIQEFYTRF